MMNFILTFLYMYVYIFFFIIIGKLYYSYRDKKKCGYIIQPYHRRFSLYGLIIFLRRQCILISDAFVSHQFF